MINKDNSMSVVWPDIYFGPINLWNCPDFEPAHSLSKVDSTESHSIYRTKELKARNDAVKRQIELANQWR